MSEIENLNEKINKLKTNFQKAADYWRETVEYLNPELDSAGIICGEDEYEDPEYIQNLLNESLK